ncbi:MAG TPA: TonB-dependent receptor [Bryobacteraceae bacterium]|nr:TonB-dependent receptor [Bryobacteraceae bacterium]
MRHLARIVLAGVSLLALPGLTPNAAHAQESRATITGTVTDPSAAVIPGATIEVTNIATGVVARTVANESGAFRIPYLIPGRYNVTASNAGFKTYARSDLELRVAETVELNIRLQLGGTNETIQVSASAEVLQATEASQSATISKAELDEIPIQGGSALELLTFAPGMSKQGELRTPYPAWNNGLTMVSSNGAGLAHNSITLDGVANESVGGPGQNGAANGYTRPAISLSSYAVEEMKIQTNVYDATQGHTSGAVFNMVSRSGTNALHGEAHYQFYPSSIAAQNPFNRSYVYYNSAEQYRYGFSLGGPVVLPKLYDGHNKTFWFFTMERHPFRTPSSSQDSVPTEAQRNGDFSALLALGGQYQIYDPSSIREHADLSRSPFPDNKIPASRISPVATNILKYISSPNNSAGVSPDGQGNYIWVDPQVDTYDTYSSRVDHSFSDRHRLMGRFSWDKWFEGWGDTYGNGTAGERQFRSSYVGAIDDVFTFSPSLVLDVKLGLTYQKYDDGPKTSGVDYAALGFAPQMTGLITKSSAIFPNIGFGDVFDNIGGTAGYYDNNTNETLNATLGWQKGKHSVRFGSEIRNWMQNHLSTSGVNAPIISFSSEYTSGPLPSSNSAPVGQGFAAFLLGVPSNATMRVASPFSANYKWGALFIQDDWRVTPKLTLNLGFRWELELPTTERYNRMEIGFDPSSAQSFGASAQAAYAAAGYAANAANIAAAANLSPAQTATLTDWLAAFPSAYNVRGGYIYASPGNRGTWKTYWKEFLPRAGLAYQLDNKTVIRGGAGIFYDSLGVGRNFLPIQDGFTRDTSIASSVDGGATYANSLVNPFPNGLLPAVGSSLGADLSAGNTIFVGYLNPKEPYSVHWSFGIQRELPGKVLLDASYVGAKGVNLPVTNGCYISGVPCTNLNLVPQRYLSNSPVYDGDNLAVLNARVPNPYAGMTEKLPNLSGATTTVRQLLQPYTQFGAIQATATTGSSMFHSLQARVERRFHRGFSFSGNFTWQRQMDSTNYLNGGDAHPAKMINGADPGLVFNAITVYELPFGKGRLLGGSWHGLLNYIFGEWQVSGTLKAQQGYPASLTDLLLLPGKTLRDLNGERDANNFFNVSALNTDTALQPGSNHLRTLSQQVSFLRGPAMWVTDGAISKKVTIRERVKGEFRFESYNATNHPNLWPWMTINSANSYGAQYNRRYNGLPRTFEFSLRVMF